MIITFRKKRKFEIPNLVGYLFFILLFLLIHYIVNYQILDPPEQVCFVTENGVTRIENVSFCVNEKYDYLPLNILQNKSFYKNKTKTQ